jgi:hypothetical protein
VGRDVEGKCDSVLAGGDSGGVLEHLRRFRYDLESTAHGALRNRAKPLLQITVVFDLVMTAVVWCAEHSSASIDNPWDAFFWTTTQLLTVSSQMAVPTTTGGRIADIAIEVYALTAMTTLAGIWASFFHHQTRDKRPAGQSLGSEPRSR